jgi:hypothetical protein
MRWRWLLAVIAIGSLVVFAMFLWWFGPFYATRGLGLWMLVSAPLFFVSYAITRARWMMHAGYILIPLGMIISVVRFPNWLENDSPIPSIVGLACAVPIILASAWALSVFGGPTRPGMLRSAVRTLSPVCLIAATVVGGTIWATSEDRPAMPQYVANFTGCYELSFGRWIPGGDEVRRGVRNIVPQHLRLDEGRVGRRLILPYWWDEGTWTPTGPQDVELSTTTGLGGLAVSLHRVRDGMLHGRALIFSDVDGYLPEPRALVTLRPEDCSYVTGRSEETVFHF